MKVYTVEFDVYYPVGAVALVVAEDKQMALLWVNKRLESLHFNTVNMDDIKEQDTTTRRVDILLDGNY